MSHADIQAHYTHFARRDVILSALSNAGKDIRRLHPDDLTPFDQLHTSGRTATAALIKLLAPQAHHHVLDIGCGIGGPARMLAQAGNCRVTGLDLTPDFITTARDFTHRTGQDARVGYVVGSATVLPFGSQSFDAAWHIHMSMNVADKPAMYGEIFRVLKSGARFVIYDPIRGEGPDLVYPAPWASDPATSFLLRRDEMLTLLGQAGFRLTDVTDATADGLAWFAERERAAMANPIKPDPRFAAMTDNHRKNLSTGAVRILCAAMTRP